MIVPDLFGLKLGVKALGDLFVMFCDKAFSSEQSSLYT